jgi:uncharacterized membrane protein
MIAVVMHGSNPTQSAEALLDKGFATPVAAESTADRLPAVTSGAPTPKAAPSTTTAPGVANAAAPRQLPGAHKASSSGILSPLPASWPVRIAVIALAVVGLFLLAKVARRPRKVRYAPSHRRREL